MLLLEAGADETSLNRNRCTPLEITGTSRREGLENVEMDDRIRRALIKAFIYRSLCWGWPVVAATDGVNSRPRGSGAGRKARGSSSLADAAAAAAAADAAAAAAAADRKLFGQLSRAVVAKLRIFRQEHVGEPPGPAATAHKIIRREKADLPVGFHPPYACLEMPPNTCLGESGGAIFFLSS